MRDFFSVWVRLVKQIDGMGVFRIICDYTISAAAEPLVSAFEGGENVSI